MSRHVLNEAQIRAELQALCLNRSPHVQRWINSTFAHWIIHEDTAGHAVDAYNVILEEEKQTRIWKTLLEDERDRLLVEAMFFDRETLPEWAVKRLDEGETVVHLSSILHRSTLYIDIQHWMDFLEDRPPRDIRMSVAQVKESVKKWDEQLKRAKLIGDIKENATPVFPEWSKHFPGTFLVRLDTAKARQNEGDYMGHCTNKVFYTRFKDTNLFSVRSQKTGLPLYTVETEKQSVMLPKSKLRIKQIKWRFNEEPLDYYKVKIINAFKAWDSCYEWESLDRGFHFVGGFEPPARVLDFLDVMLLSRYTRVRDDRFWDPRAVEFFASRLRPGRASTLPDMQLSSRLHRVGQRPTIDCVYLDMEASPRFMVDSLAELEDRVFTTQQNVFESNASYAVTNETSAKLAAPYTWVDPNAKPTSTATVHGLKPQGRVGTWSANPLVNAQKPVINYKPKRRK